jgi:hypothetical protein
MQTDQIVALLIAERDKLNRAIEALQGPTKRRGRPPKNAVGVVAAPAATAAPLSTAAAVPPSRKKRHFSAAQREAAAERMRQRWAAKRKAEAKPVAKGKRKKRAKSA